MRYNVYLFIYAQSTDSLVVSKGILQSLLKKQFRQKKYINVLKNLSLVALHRFVSFDKWNLETRDLSQSDYKSCKII